MPIYKYTGVASSGKEVKGEISASNETEAQSLLRKDRIHVVALKEKSRPGTISFSSRLSLKDISGFTRQFASMNAAAIPLVQCLESIEEQTENKALRSIVQRICADVQSGVSLAEALARHPKTFNRLYCSMVKAGEAAGILSDVLERLADYQEKAVAVGRRVKGAFAYPLLIAVVAIGALVALMTYVVPTFATMLAELNTALPFVTRFVIMASNIIKTWLPIVVIAIGAGVFAILYSYRTNESARLFIDAFSLKLPLFGDLQKKSAVSRFSRTFGALLSGGVPVADALEITTTTAGNRVLEQAFLKTLEAIRVGKPLAEPLKATGIFPPMVVQMVAVGRGAGTCRQCLRRSPITTMPRSIPPSPRLPQSWSQRSSWSWESSSPGF